MRAWASVEDKRLSHFKFRIGNENAHIEKWNIFIILLLKY